MTIHLERVSCDELKALRITCGSCKAVFELAAESLEKQENPCPNCPLCQASFLLSLGGGENQNVLLRFARALKGLRQIEKQATVAFDITTD